MGLQQQVELTVTEHVVTLVFADGEEVEVPTSPEETVLEAAKRAGWPLRSECELGACGTCKARCVSGEYELEVSGGLSKAQIQNSYVLTCVMQAQSDCRLELAYPSARLRSAGPQSIKGEISEVAIVSPEVCRFVIDLGEAGALDFEPGQYAKIVIPDTSEVRSYSFANSPSQRRLLEFFVRILPDGQMSRYLKERARPGAPIELTGPYGEFYLREIRRPVLLVAGGTGLAPMLSMLERMAERGVRDHSIKLLLGVNTVDDLFWLERLNEYQRRLPMFSYEVAVVEPDPSWRGPAGYVTALLNEADLNDRDCDVYICGPPPMIESTTAWLDKAGVAPESIYTEKFLPSDV